MKTGSVRGELLDSTKDTFDMRIRNVWGDTTQVVVPKSAVTDIRDEVDWSRVKKGAFVIVWDDDPEDYRPALWYGMTPAGKYGTSVSSIALESNEVDDWENCMLLTDWLKKEGGKNGTQ